MGKFTINQAKVFCSGVVVEEDSFQHMFGMNREQVAKYIPDMLFYIDDDDIIGCYSYPSSKAKVFNGFKPIGEVLEGLNNA